MITAIIALILLIVCFGIIIIWALRWRKNKFGVLSGKRVYSDTDQKPGVTLYSHTINLAGKPDYIIEGKDGFIPVEVKSGRTPKEPYENHVMQLMSYCLLVEENYGSAPVGGFLKYPEAEFKLLYTPEAKEGIINLVKEITRLKISGEELHCKHPEHNR
jgi:CRISPR-associated exonuclease Cas4